MGKLLYTIELVIVLLATISCSINNFINGCDLIRITVEYNTGILEIILAITVTVLGITYYQFYKLVD